MPIVSCPSRRPHQRRTGLLELRANVFASSEGTLAQYSTFSSVIRSAIALPLLRLSFIYGGTAMRVLFLPEQL